MRIRRDTSRTRSTRRLLRDAVATTLALSTGAWAPVVFADPEALKLRAGLTESSDDNIFRVPDGVPALTSGSRSDLIRSTTLGFNSARDISRQHLTIDAFVSNSRYRDHSELDNTGNAIKGNWQGEFGSHWKNNLAFDNTKQLSNFSDVRTNQKNIVSNRSLSDSLNYQLTPQFFFEASVGATRLTNGAEALRIADYSTSFRELGLLVVLPSNNQFKGSYREVDGKYPNSRFVATGERLVPVAVSNNFLQRNLDLSGEFAVTGSSRLSGRYGLTSRHFTDLPSRDFNGSTGNLNYFWNAGGGHQLNIELRRVIDATSEVTSSYFLTKGLTLRPTWTPTGKITVNGNLDWTKRDPLGDPIRVLDLLGAQADRTRTIAVTVAYAPVKWLDVALNLRSERRIADVAILSYTANCIGLLASLKY